MTQPHTAPVPAGTRPLSWLAAEHTGSSTTNLAKLFKDKQPGLYEELCEGTNNDIYLC